MTSEEGLQQLREAHFAPPAIARYLRATAARIRGDLLANPSAVRSIGSLGTAYFAAAFVAASAISLVWDRELALAFFTRTSLWMLASFGFVTLGVGLLRDRHGHRLEGLNLPLALTLLRIALVPAITLFLLEQQFLLALGIYVVAALTDVVDGMLARAWDQTTELGKVLDPLVDIAFNLAMLAGLAAAEMIAMWVLWVGVLRYGILLVGGIGLHLFVGPVRIRPTSFGRLTGVVMTSLIALYTLLLAVRGELAHRLTPLTEVALGVLLSATVVQVLLLGWFNLRVLRGQAREASRVVDDVDWRAR